MEPAAKSVEKQSGFKLVPWESWQEWNQVRQALFSSSPCAVSTALDKIAVWQARGHVPVAVEVTGDLISIQQKDHTFLMSLTPEMALPENMLRLMYAMAVMRLVNGVVDQSRKHNSTSVAFRAESAGLPRMLVDIRHEVAHKELPGISFLQLASKQALEWLKVHYWMAQLQALDDAHKHLKHKLYAHASLIHQKLALQSVGGQPKRMQYSKKKKDSEKELVKLVMSAVSDTISTLVDEGIFEQGSTGEDFLQEGGVISSGRNGATVKEPDNIVGKSVQHVQACPSEKAWRCTLEKLCSSVPQLMPMLLEQLIERIQDVHADANEVTCSTFVNLTNSTPEEVQPRECEVSWFSTSSIESKQADIGTEHLGLQGLPRRNKEQSGPALQESSKRHLFRWIIWLLSYDRNQRSRKVKDISGASKTSFNKTVLKPEADLKDFRCNLTSELLKKFLRMCLRGNMDTSLRAELVKLFVGWIQEEPLRHKVVTLVSLSSPVYDSLNRITKLDDKCVDVSNWINDCAAPDELVVSCTTNKESYELILERSKAALAESQKSLQKLRDEVVAMGLPDNTTSDDKFACAAVSTDTKFFNKSSSFECEEQFKGVWSVAKKWRPCAIGTLIPAINCTDVSPKKGKFEKDLDIDATGLDKCEKVVTDRAYQQVFVAMDSATDEREIRNAGVSCIIPMKRKAVVNTDDESEKIQAKKVNKDIGKVSCSESVCESRKEDHTTIFSGGLPQVYQAEKGQIKTGKIEGSALQGKLFLEGVYQLCQPKQLTLFQSAIHIL